MESLRVSNRLFQKRNFRDVEAEPIDDAADDGISKAAKNQRRYRERLKDDPVMFREHRERENERIKVFKSNMTEEQKAQQRLLTNIRVKRCREKKKEGLPLNKPKVKTRAASEVEREAARLRQQKLRAKFTPQKKAAVNKIRREKRAQEKAEKREKVESTPPIVPEEEIGQGYNTIDAKRKAVNKVIKSMPEDPQKFAEVLDKLTSVKSPRKTRAMEELGIHSAGKRKEQHYSTEMMKELQNQYKNIKNSRKKEHRKKRVLFGRILATSLKRNKGEVSKVRRDFGISWKYLQECYGSRDKEDGIVRRKDRLSESTQKSVQEFFERGDVSRTDPGVTSVSAKGTSKRFMEKTLLETYKEFKDDHSDARISFSRFAKCRPKHIKTVKHNKLRACCCEYCANVDLKIAAVNSFLAKKDQRQLFLGPSKYDLANITICNAAVNVKKCIDRKCRQCGVAAVRERLQPVLDDHADAVCLWQSWGLEQQTYHDRTGEQKTTSRRLLRNKEGPFDQLITELEEELVTFSRHLANAKWQHKQYALLQKNIPQGWLLMCMDFGENMTCIYQDEAQGAHWGRQQITIHPIVATYRCPDDDETVTESFVFVSSDLKHDSHAVQHFQLSVTNLLEQRGLSFQKVVHFSDGCPSQYKCKTNFADASFAADDTGIMTEKHFFGTRHGKGPCDAEIGVVKRIAFLAVRRRRAIIANARDLYRFGKTSLTKPAQPNLHCHNRRTFVFVEGGIINRTRPSRAGPDVKAIKGSRTLHCFRGLMPYVVSTRERSCFCEFCIAPQPGITCVNEEFCGFWDRVSLSKQRRRAAVQDVDAQEEVAVVDERDVDATHAADAMVLQDEVDAIAVRDEADAQQRTTAAVQDDAAQDEVAVAQRDLDDIAMHDADALVLQDDAEAQQRTTDATNGQRDVANVTVNTCVVVKYPDRHYPGVVTAVHANELQVRFLKPHATNAEVFLHPDIDDVQLVGNDMVVATHVTLIPRGRSCREWTVDGFKFS
ncbi:uncharacterized protein [Littorina saxatilis]|uniref:Uncharacterized protein n=1 Tax=Littorina saxatilis TaxID=31220 RepID=A0AAN9B5T2_9CAEN